MSTGALVFVGDARVDAPRVDDRALAYGDGLFETMRAHRGDVPWWDRHWTRMLQGCGRLRIAPPTERVARDAATALLDGGDGVLKLLVGRGHGGRGYAPRVDAGPTWMLARHPLPAPSRDPIALRWCATRLAVQPALAGIKHCNRLEQVLARAEWDAPDAVDRDADEGLMRSSDGDVVCATSGNAFARIDGRWRTPPVDRCGVAGVCRGWLLEVLDDAADVTALTGDAVLRAEAVFVCNAVRGILPVARLGDRRWPHDAATADLRARLAAAHPGFAHS